MLAMLLPELHQAWQTVVLVLLAVGTLPAHLFSGQYYQTRHLPAQRLQKAGVCREKLLAVIVMSGTSCHAVLSPVLTAGIAKCLPVYRFWSCVHCQVSFGALAGSVLLFVCWLSRRCALMQVWTATQGQQWTSEQGVGLQTG